MYTEEAWHYTPKQLKREDAVYKLGWFEPQGQWYRENLKKDMQVLESLKDNALRILERAREKQYPSCIIRLTFRLLGDSLQADLIITASVSSEAIMFLQSYSMNLPFISLIIGVELQMMLQVSDVKITSAFPNITGRIVDESVEVLGSECHITFLAAARGKCPRCWTYASDVEGEVCERCAGVLAERAQSVEVEGIASSIAN
jgi:hypothetical protein